MQDMLRRRLWLGMLLTCVGFVYNVIVVMSMKCQGDHGQVNDAEKGQVEGASRRMCPYKSFKTIRE